MYEIKRHLYNYLMDPKNPRYNFNLGYAYEKIGHTTAAASFYIRTSEFATEFEGNELLTYEALLRLALCFEKQGSRVFTVKGLLLRAISLIPNRPEAYYLLTKTYEVNKDWQEGYTFAVLGHNLKDEDHPKLMTSLDYPGKYVFTFERAVTAWWLGLWDESMHLFKKLKENPAEIAWGYMSVIHNNLNNLGATLFKKPIVYNENMYEHLKLKFPGSAGIKKNYSQCYQDLFVLTMLNGKKDGKFLEIGCADPYYGNNTVLLEKEFEWGGISIDIDQNFIDHFKKERKSTAICADATKVDYENLLEGDYDYLQLDCDPPMITYNTLLRIPFHKHRFAVITFEHDHYADPESDIRKKSRKYLESIGYELVVKDIAPDNYNSYEDWWVHPDMVDRTIIEKMKDLSDKPKRADKYMLGRI